MGKLSTLLGLICGLVLCFAEPAAAQRRVALVVGNSAYQNAARLPNPTKDADAMAELFKKAGFETIRVRKDLGQVEFRRALREFQDASENADIAVLYYAGHAVQVRDANYIVPIDAKLTAEYDAEDEAVSLDRLLAALEPAKRLRLIILDACRDNPFLKNMRRKVAVTRALSTGLARIVPPGETLVAYAAAAGSTAEDGDGDHSPFTTALLKHLTAPGLDIRLALGRVRDDVKKSTNGQQEPFVYGALGGDNVSLVPAPVAPVANLDDQRRDFDLVRGINTPKAWEIFITTHKSGMFVDLAKEQLSRVKLASAQPTESGAVVRSVPKVDAPPVSDEPTAKERRDWDRVKDSGDPEALRKFITRNPSSPLVQQAERLLEVLERSAREREEKAKVEREAARQKEEAERQAARQRADEDRRVRLEREAAKKREAEEARLRAEADRQKAEQEARERREAEAKAAAERRRAEKEAAEAAKAAAIARKRDADDARARAAEAKRQETERQAAARREEELQAHAARQQAERDAAAKRDEERKASADKRDAEQKTAAVERDVERENAAAKRAEEERKRRASEERRREQAAEDRRREKAAEERRQERAAERAEERRRERAAAREEAEERNAKKRKQATSRRDRREVREERRETRRPVRETRRSSPAPRARASAGYAPRSGGGGGGGATFTGVGF